MKTNLLLAGIATSFIGSIAVADVVYYQGFENDAWLGGKYYDTGDAGTDHWLENNEGEAAVNGDGFNAWYTNTRDGSGLVDGDFVGVTNYSSVVGAFIDGNNGYQMSDTDGMMSLVMDDFGTVNGFDFYMFVQSTGWETDDRIMVEYGDQVLYDTAGSDIDDLGIEGGWLHFVMDETAGWTGTGGLRISLDSNSASEAIFIDAISIYGDAIPAPGALALLGVAGLARRRRK